MWLRLFTRIVIITLLGSAMASGWVIVFNQFSDAQIVTPGEITLEDFTDIVTAADLGINDFSGNMGTLNEDYGQMVLNCSNTVSCTLRFEWDFGSNQQAFTGVFLSLFGLTNTLATFDGTITRTLSFTEHSLDFDRIDGVLNEPGGPRILQNVCIELSYQGTQSLKLRTELKDTQDGIRFTRLEILSTPLPQQYCWDFRNSYSVPSGNANLNLQKAKLLTLIVERRHDADGVINPQQGTINIHRIWFTVNRGETQPNSEQELLDLLERRTYQYFLDWSSRKSDSRDIPQDRSSFGDLLTVGGIGFGLPAHIIAAQRRWITREEAITRTLNVLRTLDNASTFGYEPVGRIGYKGWFYHFLGVDGKRKLNFDFPETSNNEALNTVELSTIDTGLALMGVLAAQSYFSRNNPTEAEIRRLAQEIYDRVDWPFMLEPVSQQFYLGWKPSENRNGPSFEVPDGEGKGKYSGIPGNPDTLDFYTDEALIVILLAVGSPAHPVSPTVYNALQRSPSDSGLIRTYPGSLFTYQFLHAFLDTRNFLLSCPGDDPSNWFENSRQAILKTIEYSETNPRGFLTYGSDAWGLSAADGPFDGDNAYHAYGAPPVAVDPQPAEDGTVTYYSMLSAINFWC